MKSPRARSFARSLALRSSAALLGAFAFASLPESARSQESPELPNIVIMLIDDMGIMDTSVPFLTDEAGEPVRYPLNDYFRTPSMERLAERGIRFNQFYAMSVCSPSRIALVTGQNAARHRTTNWINPWENNRGERGPEAWNWTGLQSPDGTLQARLAELGYRTMHVGKAHFGPDGTPGSDPANLGFEINIGGSSFGAPASYLGENNYGHGMEGRRARMAVPHLEAYHGTDTHLTEALTIEANRLVAEAATEGVPFFLHFSHYAVHSPFELDERFAEHYADSGKSPQAQAFATLVEGVDKSLGDLLDQLEALGIAENTLIFFLGDNGTDAPLGDQHVVACAEPLRGKKGSHYEGGIRTCFFAAWAAHAPENPWQAKLPIAAGTIQSQAANLTDLFPTILGLVDEVPDDRPVDGERLDLLLTGETDPSRDEQFLMHYPHGPHRSNYFTVWRDGDWKLIYHYLPEIPTHGDFIQLEEGNHELFDLAADPWEQNNLAAEQPETVARMVEGMKAQLEAMRAVFPVDEDGEPLLPTADLAESGE